MFQAKQLDRLHTLTNIPRAAWDDFLTNESKIGYLERGHLTPSADMIYSTMREETSFYMNAAPQWHSVNTGNWGALERESR